MGRHAGDRLDERFARLWAAGTSSALGSGLAVIATPLLVASRTSDPLVVSAAAGAAWLPWLLFALPGGVLVDRVDRRRLMILVDWARAVAVGVLAAAIASGWVSIPLLYGVLFLVNSGEILMRTAGQAMLPDVVPRERLERANGWLVGGTMLAQGLIAGPLASGLFVVAASLPFFVNAGAYAGSAVLLAVVAGSYRPASRPTVSGGAVADGAVEGGAVAGGAGTGGAAGAGWWSVRAELAGGLRWLVRQRLLRTMALLIGLLNVTLTAALAVLVLLARERLHAGSVGYGLLLTAMAVGGILGSVVGDRLISRVTATWTVRVGLLIEALTHLALAASRSAYVVGFALFAFGVHGSLWGIVASSLRQRLTPPDMLGRVGSAYLFISAGGNCVGALLGGVVAASFGLTAPYWVGFVVALLVSAATWRVFNRATVSAAYAVPTPRGAGEPADRPAAVG